MNALLPFVILGITAGSVYGLTGTGLVLTYKTSGIFNFAQGAVATTGAYVFYILHDDVLHLPAIPTALICVFVLGPVLGLGMETMARRRAWIIGSSFATLAGILLAPTLNLDATVLTLLVVQAFGAAAIGRFSSLPLTYIGGLVIGIAASVATKYVVTSSAALAGLPASIPFIVLFLVLIFTPRSRLAERRAPLSGALAGYAAPARVQLAGAVVLGAVLLAIPHVVDAGQLPYWSDGPTRGVL